MNTASERPLTSDEINELDAMFMALPEEREPYDLSMADGFLAGVLVHPTLVLPSQWLPMLVDPAGGSLDFGTAKVDIGRFTELVMRRYNELAAHIAAREPFAPILAMEEDDGSAREADAPPADEPLLAFWCSGFLDALTAWPGVDALPPERIAPLLSAFLRHLPPGDDEDLRRVQREMADVLPAYASTDDAVEDLVESVLQIADLTRPRQPMRRERKTGRNDSCWCGSGRKYKHCHGAG